MKNLRVLLLMVCCVGAGCKKDMINGKNFTAVFINPNADDIAADLNISNTNIKFTTAYTTSQADELKANKVTGVRNVIPARSIITLTGIIK
jgi:hypothetical protein